MGVETQVDRVERLTKNLFRRIKKRTAGIEPEGKRWQIREELKEAGELRFWELILSGKEHDDSYLMKSAWYAVVDEVRKRKVRGRVKYTSKDSILENGALKNDSSPEDLSVDTKDLLSILPENLREVFSLHAIEGYTYRQLAHRFNRPVT